jgi:hypothetical protein
MPNRCTKISPAIELFELPLGFGLRRQAERTAAFEMNKEAE